MELNKLRNEDKKMKKIESINYIHLQNFLSQFKIYETFGHPILDIGANIKNDKLFLYYDTKLNDKPTSSIESYYASFYDLLFKYRTYGINYSLQDFTIEASGLIDNLINKYTNDHI